MRAARRCTAPMKAPSPPPTMPSRTRPLLFAESFRPSIAIFSCPLLDAEHALIGGEICAAGCEIIKGLLGHFDDVVLDEDRPFAGTFFRMLQAAFPFEDRPALETVLREFREDA